VAITALLTGFTNESSKATNGSARKFLSHKLQKALVGPSGRFENSTHSEALRSGLIGAIEGMLQTRCWPVPHTFQQVIRSVMSARCVSNFSLQPCAISRRPFKVSETCFFLTQFQ